MLCWGQITNFHGLSYHLISGPWNKLSCFWIETIPYTFALIKESNGNPRKFYVKFANQFQLRSWRPTSPVRVSASSCSWSLSSSTPSGSSSSSLQVTCLINDNSVTRLSIMVKCSNFRLCVCISIKNGQII